MYDYVTQDIYSLLQTEFEIDERISISGHSMGGHGALVIGLRESEKFKSISAFAPIVNPMRVPWGQKALAAYLGPDEETWKAYDAVELIKSGATHSRSILIDQGDADEFLAKQLTPEALQTACRKNGRQELRLRMQEGYDHSYYFIASFIRDHVEFHAGRMES